MLSFIDRLFPWFGDMVDLGGDILLAIIFMALLIWAFYGELMGLLMHDSLLFG